MDAHVGDVIEVRGVKVGQPVRRGTVRELLDDDPVQIRVAWEDGHESVFWPTGGMMRVVASADG